MKKIFLTVLTLTAFQAFAEDVNIKSVELKNDKANESRLSIRIAGNLIDNPVTEINDKILTVTIPNSHVASKIIRRFDDTIVSASQTDRSTVAIKTTLPYSLKGKEALVNITLKDGAVDVSFPRTIVAKNSRAPSVVKENAIAKVEVVNPEAEKLDEGFLNKLANEQEKLAAAKHPETELAVNKKTTNTVTSEPVDRVNVTQSGVQKATAPTANGAAKTTEMDQATGKSNFSIAGYVGKFVAFLSLMILGFYGVLTLFKKGVIKKGKLGFLHSTKLVEVLSTTHVAPKRTLMMVKAHKQVFLISSSESGMQLISEIQDVNGLIKNGEEELTGSNFDTNLNRAHKEEKVFKLKEDTIASDYSLDDMLNEDDSMDIPLKTSAARSIEKAPIKDEVRFSDQIKTKVKNLKQL